MKGKARVLVETIAGKTLRVAVLGAKDAGKTTFIVSLLQQLRNCSPTNVAKLHDWTPQVGKQLKPENNFKQFSLNAAIEKIQQGKWPDPTSDVSQYRVPIIFHHQKRRPRRIELQILDIPGERVADFGMFEKNYDDWCDFMEEQAEGSQVLRDYFLATENIFDQRTKSENDQSRGATGKALAEKTGHDLDEELQKEYRKCLHELKEEKSVFISPSTALLDKKGNFHENKDGALGFDDTHQFVPLPKSVRTKENRVTVKRFAQAYKGYVDQIVTPVVKWLESADKVVYLVDVLTLLNEGSAAYSTQKAMGNAALNIFSRQAKTTFGRGWEWLFDSRADNIQLLATQADRVPKNQHGNMKKLLDQMHGQAVRSVEGAKYSIGIVTACSTTKEETDKKTVKLRGMFVNEKNRGNKEKNESLISFVDKHGISDPTRTVPAFWPSETPGAARNWTSGEFQFDKTHPKPLMRDNSVPPQREIVQVIKALFDL